MGEDDNSNVCAIITRLVWTAWTSMSTVPKKAIKLNHSLTIWWRRSRTPLTSDVLITTVSVKRYQRAPVYDLHCGAAVNCCISEDHLFHCRDVWPLGGATGGGDITSSGDGWPLPCPFRCLPTSSSCRLWSRPVTIWKSRLTVLFDWALISVKSIRLTAYVLTLITKFAWISSSSIHLLLVIRLVTNHVLTVCFCIPLNFENSHLR